MTIINNNIIEQFEKLKKQIQFESNITTSKDIKIKNEFRIKAITNVINEIKKFKTQITSVSQISNIKHIGKKSIERIREILNTNKLSEIKMTGNMYTLIKLMEKMEDVIGIGPKNAYELITKHNIKTPEELKTAIDNKIITLPVNVSIGLKYLNKINTNIKREIINEIDILFDKITLTISPKLFHVLCGSYRRKSTHSGDIDVIIMYTDYTTKNDIKNDYLKLFIEKLMQTKFIIENLTNHGKTKYMGICKYKKEYYRIDIRFFAMESYYSAILYFTGSKKFNVQMRNVAISMGYMLNEYGLFDEKGKLINTESEREIFEKLNMEYVLPENR